MSIAMSLILLLQILFLIPESGPGGDPTEECPGVNYKALCDLFSLSEQRSDSISYRVSVQMIEIYNDQVRDLLVCDGVNKKLEIRKSSQNGINVPDANIFQVSTTSDVVNLMNLGQRNRAVSATALNDRSSRSHSCLTIHVEGRETTNGSTLHGCMHLVDLAGSERVEKTEVTGDRLKEATHINKSLSALGDVISALAQKNPHVPYRNSKLTQLLQDSLGGQAKTLMFVHISPESDSLLETISTLKFAERVSSVELGAARINRDYIEVKELKGQVATLKAALARKDGEQEKHLRSRSSSPGELITKSAGASPPHHSWKDMESSFTSINPTNYSTKHEHLSEQRRQSLDLHQLMKNSLEFSPQQQPIKNSGGQHLPVTSSGVGSSGKKAILENRGMILGMDPPPLRRLSLGPSPPLYRPRKPSFFSDGRQKPPGGNR